jgi:hypothetical protein
MATRWLLSARVRSRHHFFGDHRSGDHGVIVGLRISELAERASTGVAPRLVGTV